MKNHKMTEQELAATLSDAIKQINELKRRLAFAEEDARQFKAWAIDNGFDLYRPTDVADYAWSHIENILIATDLNNDESDNWTNY
jgi:hypothetical protein